VWRANDSSAAAAGQSSDEPLEDPVLASFALCLEAGLLAVWRRVPRRCLVDYSFDNAGNQVKQPKTGHDDKNQLSQCKELWLFWYGEKPTEQLRSLVSDSLKEISDCSGSWEAGIPYEARTLLFKALNNLIERSLLSREFVRIGKWFVQPYDGSADQQQRPGAKTTSHLRNVAASL
jgi:mediator of RNA polymerase II transcription subunit 13